MFSLGAPDESDQSRPQTVGTVFKVWHIIQVGANPCSCILFSFKLFPDNFMKREALSLVVACPNSNIGCVWKGEVRNVEVSKSSN